jgi:ankyrin repeat protein
LHEEHLTKEKNTLFQMVSTLTHDFYNRLHKNTFILAHHAQIITNKLLKELEEKSTFLDEVNVDPSKNYLNKIKELKAHINYCNSLALIQNANLKSLSKHINIVEKNMEQKIEKLHPKIVEIKEEKLETTAYEKTNIKTTIKVIKEKNLMDSVFPSELLRKGEEIKIKETPEKIKLPKEEKNEPVENKKSKTPKASQKKQKKSKKNTCQKILEKHQSLNQDLTLTNSEIEKISLLSHINILQQEAHEELHSILKISDKYFTIENNDLENLIKIIPRISPDIPDLAVQYDRINALNLLFKNHSYLRLDATALRGFYNAKINVEIFEHFANVTHGIDEQDEDGNSLLINACYHTREKEMIILLKAGASTTTKNNQGFSAFGSLTMRENKNPNLKIVESFIKNSSSFNIDFMQGSYPYSSTPLIFACQKNQTELGKLLLQNGADPRAARLPDTLTALEVCAGKGYNTFCEIILSKSQYPINDICSQALRVATQRTQMSTAKTIKTFMEKNKIEQDDTKKISYFPAGTGLQSMFTAMGISSNRIENTLKESEHSIPQISNNSTRQEQNDSLSEKMILKKK